MDELGQRLADASPAIRRIVEAVLGAEYLLGEHSELDLTIYVRPGVVKVVPRAVVLRDAYKIERTAAPVRS
jgi:hypothetical protein